MGQLLILVPIVSIEQDVPGLGKEGDDVGELLRFYYCLLFWIFYDVHNAVCNVLRVLEVLHKFRIGDNFLDAFNAVVMENQYIWTWGFRLLDV